MIFICIEYIFPSPHFQKRVLASYSYKSLRVILDFASPPQILTNKFCLFQVKNASHVHHFFPRSLPSHPTSLLSPQLLGGASHCTHCSSPCSPLPSTARTTGGVTSPRGIQFLFLSVLQTLFPLPCPVCPPLCHVPERLTSENWVNRLLSIWASSEVYQLDAQARDGRASPTDSPQASLPPAKATAP